MARPKAFDISEALDAAVRVFWERGYEATSIEDLVHALGINRASLYGTFGDKAQLFAAAIDRYVEQLEAGLALHLAPPHSGREAVSGYLAAVIEQATQPGHPRGCLLLNTAVGCITAPRALLERATAALRHNEDAFHAALRRDPALSAREDLRPLARFFSAQSHGLALLARTGAKRVQLQEAASIALRVLDTKAARAPR
jgi:TetR/AcrR family transcriptional repressor of nem operon